jgi:type VI secretion system protein ImpH
MAKPLSDESVSKLSFIPFLRRLVAKHPKNPIVGSATRPSFENFRLGQNAHMIFPPRDLMNVYQEDGKTHLNVFSPGFWGPQGALPLSWTETIYKRNLQHDNTISEFVNIFQHRLLAEFWRAWFVSQDTASLDNPSRERFSFFVASLIGMDPEELTGMVLPVHSKLASASHVIREARNPEGLTGALHYYFDVPVQLEEYVGQWIHIELYEQSRLADYSESSILGTGTILGDTVMDYQHKFKLIFGPLSLEQYLRFSPWGEDLPVLKDWVRNFVGFEYDWEVALILKSEEVPYAKLGDYQQLGYTGWLSRSDTKADLPGMSFTPENHIN